MPASSLNLLGPAPALLLVCFSTKSISSPTPFSVCAGVRVCVRVGRAGVCVRGPLHAFTALPTCILARAPSVFYSLCIGEGGGAGRRLWLWRLPEAMCIKAITRRVLHTCS
eukprot:6175869-Pleurochrysis_carterae.AAC.14